MRKPRFLLSVVPSALSLIVEKNPTFPRQLEATIDAVNDRVASDPRMAAS